MAFVRISNTAIYSNQLPPVCMCCGQPARLATRTTFRFDPAYLMFVSLILPKFAS